MKKSCARNWRLLTALCSSDRRFIVGEAVDATFTESEVTCSSPPMPQLIPPMERGALPEVCRAAWRLGGVRVRLSETKRVGCQESAKLFGARHCTLKVVSDSARRTGINPAATFLGES